MPKMGHPLLDRDHAIIIGAIEQLSHSHIFYDKTLRFQALEQILEYATNHLIREERLMCVLGYPGYQEHCKVHEEIQSNFLKYIKPALKGTMAQKDLLDALTTTFISHMNSKDTEFADWIKTRG